MIDNPPPENNTNTEDPNSTSKNFAKGLFSEPMLKRKNSIGNILKKAQDLYQA